MLGNNLIGVDISADCLFRQAALNIPVAISNFGQERSGIEC